MSEPTKGQTSQRSFAQSIMTDRKALHKGKASQEIKVIKVRTGEKVKAFRAESERPRHQAPIEEGEGGRRCEGGRRASVERARLPKGGSGERGWEGTLETYVNQLE